MNDTEAEPVRRTSRTYSSTSPSTRLLLACGAIAGPLFVVTALVQAITRDGFDLGRHPFSMLSLGDLGWIQITNFVVCGTLFVACAIGTRRVLRPGRGATWAPLLIGTFGAAQIAGGVFLADPALGFPAGTGDGPAETVSWHSGLHGIAFAVGMTSLVAACFVLARRFAGEGDRGWAWYSALTGVAFVVLAAVGVPAGDFRIVTVAIVLGWGWVALVAARLRAEV